MKNRYQQNIEKLMVKTIDFRKTIDQLTKESSHNLSPLNQSNNSFEMRKTIDTPNVAQTERYASEYQPQKSKQKQFKIRDKFNTFYKWSALTEYRNFKKQIRQTSRSKKKEENDPSKAKSLDFMKALLTFTAQLERKKKREKAKQQTRKKKPLNINSVEDRENFHEQHRERLKKQKNPLGIVHHYNRHFNYSPSKYQDILINKLISLKIYLQSNLGQNQLSRPKKTLNNKLLDQILQKIYELMNIAVDFNEMRLLIITILLAADTSFYSLDYKRAFYFYRQAGIAADFSQILEFKIQSFLGMSKIAYQLNDTELNITFLKRALAYSWFLNNKEMEMLVYELMGKAYFMEGSVQKAKYYHERSSQQQAEKMTAIKLICLEVINDYRKDKNFRLYDGSITLLFIETLRLPIKNFKEYAKQIQETTDFQNHINGDSPRKSRDSDPMKFTLDDFPDLQEQIKSYIDKDPEFQKNMPEPEGQLLYIPKKRYGKIRRQIQFQRSVEYHRIADQKCKEHSKLKSKSISRDDYKDLKMKMPLDQQVEEMIKEKPNENFMKDIMYNIKMSKLHKVGDLKQRVYKGHLKVKQRKRDLSTQSDKIKFTLNKALIDWIDPAK